MQNKYVQTLASLVLFLPLVMLFSIGCGPNCSPSATGTVPIRYGDPGNSTAATNTKPDTVRIVKTPELCSGQGICMANATDSLSKAINVNVSCTYTQSTNATPSTFTMSFPYATLFQNQPAAAIFFYNNQPLSTYQFISSYAISNLGGNFANVCGTINNTAAGAGAITYQPAIDTSKPPSNQNMNSQVIVTFTVTP